MSYRLRKLIRISVSEQSECGFDNVAHWQMCWGCAEKMNCHWDGENCVGRRVYQALSRRCFKQRKFEQRKSVPLFGRARSQCRVGYAIPLFVAQLICYARISMSVAFSCAVCLLLSYFWCNDNRRACVHDSPDTCHTRHREIMMPAGTMPDKCGSG